MDKKRIIPIAIIGVLALVGIGTAIVYNTNTAARTQIDRQLDAAQSNAPGVLKASGFIEAESVELSTERGGRVVELPYAEGDEIEAGDMLLRIDTALLEAQRDAAQAQLQIMVAQRDLLEATPRDEVIAQAQAQVAIAQAAVNAAEVAWQGAAAIAADPQSVQLQVVDAQTQLAIASQQLTAAQVGFTSADRSLELYYYSLDQVAATNDALDDYGIEVSLPLEMTFAPKRYEQAVINLQSAQDAVTNANDLLATVQSFANNPAGLQAVVADAHSRLQTSQAAVERAQAELEALKDGPGPEDLAVADARIDEAQAAVDAMDAQISRLTLSAPIGGIVLEQTVHIGELALPGAPLITLANLDSVELTVYLPEDQLDEVALGQTVRIKVDSFPGQTFEGEIVNLSDEAEFTPRGVQTREERVNLVFAIKIRIPNPDHTLKPGMPADALLD